MAIAEAEIKSAPPADAGVFLNQEHGLIVLDEARPNDSGRFIPVKQPNLYWTMLRAVDREVMITDSAEILWAALGNDGKVVELADREPGGREIFLGFDASKAEQGIFRWEIMVTGRNGSTRKRLTIDNGKRSAYSMSLGRHHIVTGQADFNDEETDALTSEVVFLAGHELTRWNLEATYESKVRLEKRIGEYAITGRSFEFSNIVDPPKVREKEMARLEKIRRGIGLRPYTFIETPQERAQKARLQQARRVAKAAIAQ